MTIPISEKKEKTQLNVEQCSIGELHQMARAYMAEYGCEFNGDFENTGKDPIKFNGEPGRTDKRCWLHVKNFISKNGIPGIYITFGFHDGTEDNKKYEETFWANDEFHSKLTSKEKEEIARAYKERKQKQAAKEKEEIKKANKKAKSISNAFHAMKNELPPEGEDTYFSKKGFNSLPRTDYIKWSCEKSPYKKQEYVAVIALVDIDGEIKAQQKLYPSKRAFGEGEQRNKNYIGKNGGCFCVFGKIENGKEVLVCEGVATALSVYLAVNKTTVSAMSTSNLEKVVTGIKEKYPESEITICADNDHQHEKGNPGLDRAKAVAKKHSCKLTYPEFTEEEKFNNEEPRTDFDDLRQLNGLEAVKERIEQAISLEDIKNRRVLIPVKGSGVRLLGFIKEVSEVLNKEKKYFKKYDGAIHSLKPGKKNELFTLKSISPSAFMSILELHADVGVINKKGEFIGESITESTAKAVLNSPLLDLPRVSILSASPVLTIRNNKPYVITEYDQELEILVTNQKKRKIHNLTLEESVELLLGIYCDYDFATEADRSRAIAALITPALIQGELIKGRAPIGVINADKSQAGKGTFVKIILLIYREIGEYLSQRKKGGVGSLDEDYLSALGKGAPFIIFDNIREKFSSQLVESALTENSVSGRGAYQKNQTYDPRKVFHMLTSNNAELNTDMTNRALFISIKKRNEQYEFREFKEGDIEDYCRENQQLLHEAIHVVLSYWIEKGCPVTKENKHNRREWCRAVDWIVQNIFKLPPVMDGHNERKEISKSQHLTWLKKVAVEVSKARPDEYIPMSKVLEIIKYNDEIEIPGCKNRDEIEEYFGSESKHKYNSIVQQMGRRFSAAFKKLAEGEEEDVDKITINLDGYSVTRLIEKKYTEFGRGAVDHKTYVFLPVVD